MWKRITATVMAVGLAGTLLAGCAGQKQAEAPKDNGTTAAPAPKNVEIVFWEQQEDADKFFDPVIQKFMDANKNIKVTRVHYETEKLRENFLTAVQGGQGPQVLFGPDDQTGVFATAGVVQPLDNFFSPGYLDGINKAALAGSKMDGKLWGVPAWIGNQLMLIYNKKFVQTPPANTDDLMKMAADFKAKNTVQYALAFNQTEPFFFAPWLAAFGGKVFDDKNNPTLDTPAMVDAYKLIMNFKAQGVMPKESDYDGTEALFKDGKAAMVINGPWALGGYTDAKIDWGIAKIPQVSGKGWPQPYTSTKAYYVSKTVTDPDMKAAVQKFIEYMTSEDTEKALFALHKETPANLKVAASDVVKNDPILAAQQTQLEQVTPMPNIVQMRYVWDSWKPQMQLVFANKATPEAAAKQSQADVEKLIKENK